jgi:hypothetical protein
MGWKIQVIGISKERKEQMEGEPENLKSRGKIKVFEALSFLSKEKTQGILETTQFKLKHICVLLLESML